MSRDIEEEKQNLLHRTAKNIANIRNKLNVGQVEFASMIGVSRATVGNWEQGVTPIKIEHAIRISALAKVSLDEIFLNTAQHFTANLDNLSDKESAVVLEGMNKLAIKDKVLFNKQIDMFLRLKEDMELS